MKITTTLLSSAFLALAGFTSATTLVFNLNTVYTGDTPAGAAPWVTITVTDVAMDTVNLRVDHNASSAAGQFVSVVYLNMDPFVSALAISNELNSNKRHGALDISLDGVHGAAGNLFDLGVHFETSDKDGGIDRLKPGEFWSADLTGTGLTASAFNAVTNHGLDSGGFMQGLPRDGSSHVTTPEPASMAVVAFGALALLRRRRRA